MNTYFGVVSSLGSLLPSWFPDFGFGDWFDAPLKGVYAGLVTLLTGLWQWLLGVGTGFIGNAITGTSSQSQETAYHVLVSASDGTSGILRTLTVVVTPVVVIAMLLQLVSAAWQGSGVKAARAFVGGMVALPVSIFASYAMLNIRNGVDNSTAALFSKVMGKDGSQLTASVCGNYVGGSYDPDNAANPTQGVYQPSIPDDGSAASIGCYFNDVALPVKTDFTKLSTTELFTATGTSIILCVLALIFVLAACAFWMSMMFRDFAIIAIVALAPVVFAMLPFEAAKEWIKNWMKILVGFILAKPLAIIVISVFSYLIKEQNNSFFAFIFTVLALLIATASPQMAARLVDFTGGQSVGALGAADAMDPSGKVIGAGKSAVSNLVGKAAQVMKNSKSGSSIGGGQSASSGVVGGKSSVGGSQSASSFGGSTSGVSTSGGTQATKAGAKAGVVGGVAAAAGVAAGSFVASKMKSDLNQQAQSGINGGKAAAGLADSANDIINGNVDADSARSGKGVAGKKVSDSAGGKNSLQGSGSSPASKSDRPSAIPDSAEMAAKKSVSQDVAGGESSSGEVPGSTDEGSGTS
ncbi:MAG: hypothetical protein QM571_02955, partial [Micrococcaceae bacterium]